MLYERPSFTAYNQNIEQYHRLLRDKNDAARAAADGEKLPEVPPGQEVGMPSRKPQMHSTRNPFKAGDIVGHQRTQVPFNP